MGSDKFDSKIPFTKEELTFSHKCLFQAVSYTTPFLPQAIYISPGWNPWFCPCDCYQGKILKRFTDSKVSQANLALCCHGILLITGLKNFLGDLFSK